MLCLATEAILFAATLQAIPLALNAITTMLTILLTFLLLDTAQVDHLPSNHVLGFGLPFGLSLFSVFDLVSTACCL